MFSITLIGTDGTGKSTMSKMLRSSFPIPTKYIYMGINLEASNVMLPTTWLWYKLKRANGELNMGGPPDPNRVQTVSGKNFLKRMVREVKSGVRMANLIAEEWFRQFVAWYYQARGYIVIFDRHFYFDYYKHHIANIGAGLTMSDRVHGLMLNYIFPKPDLVICLDAPAEVLFARKKEGTVELLEQRRQEYLRFRNDVKDFVSVDTTQPMDEVASQITKIVMDFYQTKKSLTDASSKFRAKRVK
jgi:thymidylate kinase